MENLPWLELVHLQDCKHPLGRGAVSGSCDFDGFPFQLPVDTPDLTAPLSITAPLIVGASVSGAPRLPLALQFYGNIQVNGISPRSAPIYTNVMFRINVDRNTTAAGGGSVVPLRDIFNASGAVCRMDRCNAIGCSSPGPNCRCSSESKVPGSRTGRLEMFNDSLLTCSVTNTSMQTDGLYVVALSVNGQDFFMAPDSTAVLFFRTPRFIDATPPGDGSHLGRKNFGVVSGDSFSESPTWGFAAAASSVGGLPLVAFFVEPDCRAESGSVACAMRFDAFSSCSSASNVDCQGRSANPSIRFVPGRCLPNEPCSCEDTPSSRTAPLDYAGIQPSYREGVPYSYSVLNGTVPGPGESGKLGVHYVCFSVDGISYALARPQVICMWRMPPLISTSNFLCMDLAGPQ